MDLEEYLDHDAVGLAGLVSAGDVSPDELLDVALDAVEAVNPSVNAVVQVFEGRARDAIAAGLTDGPLRGVPYLLKDLTAMLAGVPTTSGSRFFADHVPDYDSTTVARLQAAGLVVFGKTNSPELGGNASTEPQQWGPSRNPWDTSRSTGGSSGGSAAAVAAGIVPAAHATDGGGSIRIPSACCGVFGFKPSRGRTSAGPILGEGWSGMSAEHAITRSVRDSAALLDAIAGAAPGDPYTAEPAARPYLDEVGREPGRLRIAMTTVAPSGAPVEPDVVAAVEEAARLCEALGHEVVEATPDYDAAKLSECALRIMAVHYLVAVTKRSEAIGREPEHEELERVMWHRLGIARQTTGLEYARAVEGLHLAGRQVGGFMVHHDVILRPTVARTALPLGVLDMNTEDLPSFLGALWGFAPFTLLFNATGQPAMSVPFGTSTDGMPIGVQFAARRGEDDLLFRLAGQLERARSWWARRPAVHAGVRS